MESSPPGLFASTVPHYARFRSAYGARLFALLSARFSLDGTQRVLDLGAGCAALTLPLAALVREVVAVDPEPQMIAEGRRLAAVAGVGQYRLAAWGLEHVAGVERGSGIADGHGRVVPLD
ncbi:methyltransferase domain-containing protein [Streptomyces cirratus]